MKKQKIIWIALAVLIFLNACGVRNVTRGMEEGEHYDAVISVKGNSAAPADEEAETAPADLGSQSTGEPSEEKKQLEQLQAMLGREDEEAAGMLGGGEENRTADGSILVGRSYETELFGKAAHLYTSYDENGYVGMIFLEIAEGDAGQFLEILKEITGMEPEVPKDEEETGWRWQLQGCVLTLYEIEGMVSMDLVPVY